MTGVSELSCLLFSQHGQDLVERRHMERLAPVYRYKAGKRRLTWESYHRNCTERELNLALPEGKFKFGKYIQTMQIDMDLYLKYLTDKFKSNGMFQLKPITAVLKLVSYHRWSVAAGSV